MHTARSVLAAGRALSFVLFHRCSVPSHHRQLSAFTLAPAPAAAAQSGSGMTDSSAPMPSSSSTGLVSGPSAEGLLSSPLVRAGDSHVFSMAPKPAADADEGLSPMMLRLKKFGSKILKGEVGDKVYSRYVHPSMHGWWHGAARRWQLYPLRGFAVAPSMEAVLGTAQRRAWQCQRLRRLVACM